VNILALDTAAEVLSLALSAGEEVWYFEGDLGGRRGDQLMAAADRLLDGAGIEPGDLHLAACMKGPGSFTGLRIAYAAAKGLALSLGIPMVAAPTLDCMAAPWDSWPGIVLPAMDAKKGRFYAALYRGGRRLGEFLDAAPEELAAALAGEGGGQTLLTGPAARQLLEKLKPPSPDQFFVDPRGNRGNARELLDMVKKSGTLAPVGELFSGPLYLRKSDAELNSRPR
jgi:tRNA threonylcarbamoyladenosine biosynthesis protein TsaB